MSSLTNEVPGEPCPGIEAVTGGIPYRIALAGGWIDQPFVSSANPCPPGSMVVASVVPRYRFMDLCGMATSTRRVASRIWGDTLPDRESAELVRELYRAENEGKPEPSGSQDMVGLVYPGISRIDYESEVEGGYFPSRVESCRDPDVARWLESVIHVLPVAQRPSGYSPLVEKHIEPLFVRKLGESGKLCYDSILARDLPGLQRSFVECTEAWAALLPATLKHPSIQVDLVGIRNWYSWRYGGAMYSGCGGGYLFVATTEPVPGSFQVSIRL